jgi:NADH-quinone oxidoreductase subunit J
MAEWILFVAFAALAVGAAILVVLPPMARNPLHAAVALMASLTGVAGLYLLLAAHLLAVLQILVYVGAVVTLFLFVIMLLNLAPEELGRPRVTFAKVLASVAVLAFAGLVAARLWSDPPLAAPAPVDASFGWVAAVARPLFTDYLVPFELLSVFLLVAIVGAVVLARRDA